MHICNTGTYLESRTRDFRAILGYDVASFTDRLIYGRLCHKSRTNPTLLLELTLSHARVPHVASLSSQFLWVLLVLPRGSSEASHCRLHLRVDGVLGWGALSVCPALAPQLAWLLLSACTTHVCVGGRIM